MSRKLPHRARANHTSIALRDSSRDATLSRKVLLLSQGLGDGPRRADGAGNHCTTPAYRPNTYLWDHLGADTAVSLPLSEDRSLPERGILHRQVGTVSGTSLAAFFTNLRKSRVTVSKNNELDVGILIDIG